jgi:hypothetical protein
MTPLVSFSIYNTGMTGPCHIHPSIDESFVVSQEEEEINLLLMGFPWKIFSVILLMVLVTKGTCSYRACDAFTSMTDCRASLQMMI